MDFINNILVIGNGFDLAHKLPTTYGDFLKFVQNFQEYQKGNMSQDNTFYTYFKKLQEEKIEIFNEINALVSNNFWFIHFISIFEERCSEGKTGWIDFESEISTVIQHFDGERLRLKNKSSTSKPITNIKQLSNALFESNFSPDNYKKFKCKLYEDLNRLTRCLEIYLSNYIKTDSCQKLDIIKNLQIDGVISFNYTNTFEVVYGKIFPDVKYDYIHGKAKIDGNIDNCNLVLGIDEYLQGEQRDKDNEFIQFKKFFQRIYKGTGSRYIDWLDDLNLLDYIDNKRGLNIYVYGHSLDVTDADIFRRIILTKGAKTHIFYHNQTALSNQIANLVKIIGEEKLIQFTYESKRKIEFVSVYQ
ncbi:MAG: bacteriophage abortive infection AbiH family protein [Ruminococcus sp.]|nr:bacteriophage abortive infection AbiH family protein [Ruminococcus sp.]